MWAAEASFEDNVVVDTLQASIDHWDDVEGRQRELGRDEILAIYERISGGRREQEGLLARDRGRGGGPVAGADGEGSDPEPPLATARTHSWPARPRLRGAPTSARRHRVHTGAEVLGAALVSGSGTLGTEVATAHRSMRGVVIRKAVRPVPLDRIGEFIPNGVIVGTGAGGDEGEDDEEPPFKIVGGPAPLVLPPPRGQEDPWASAFADIAALVPPPPLPPPQPQPPPEPSAEDQVAAMTARVRMLSQAPRPNTRPSQALSGTLMTTDLANLIPIRLHTVPAMDAASSSARGSARSGPSGAGSRGPEEAVTLTSRRAEAQLRRQRQQQEQLRQHFLHQHPRSSASLANTHRSDTLTDLFGDSSGRKEGYNVSLKDWKEMRDTFKFSSKARPQASAAASSATHAATGAHQGHPGEPAAEDPEGPIHRGVEEILGNIESRESFTLPEPEIHNTIDMDLDNLGMEKLLLEAKKTQRQKAKGGRAKSGAAGRGARQLLKDKVPAAALGDLEDDIFESVVEVPTAAAHSASQQQEHRHGSDPRDQLGQEQAKRAAERELLIENDLRDKDMRRRERAVAQGAGGPAPSVVRGSGGAVIEQAGLYGNVHNLVDDGAELSEQELGIVEGMIVSGTDAPIDEIIHAEPFLQFVEFNSLVNQNNALRASLKAKNAGRKV